MQYYEATAAAAAAAAAAESWGYYVAVKQKMEMISSSSSSSVSVSVEPIERIYKMACGNAVVIFSSSGCCMCHAVKRLFCGMGVNPRVYELDHEPMGNDLHRALMFLISNNNNNSSSSSSLPVVFIGGKLVGAMDRVMASHITGSLVPLLKQAGALWL